MTQSLVKPAMRLESIRWPDNTRFAVHRDNVETIIVTQLAGPMGFYDAARVIFDNRHNNSLNLQGDLVVPLHMLASFRITPAIATPEEGNDHE